VLGALAAEDLADQHLWGVAARFQLCSSSAEDATFGGSDLEARDRLDGTLLSCPRRRSPRRSHPVARRGGASEIVCCVRRPGDDRARSLIVQDGGADDPGWPVSGPRRVVNRRMPRCLCHVWGVSNSRRLPPPVANGCWSAGRCQRVTRQGEQHA
jgi:hypothetical protein